MPASRQGVAKAVYSAFRFAEKPVADGKIDPGGSQGQHRLPGIRHADAYRTGSVIAAASDHQRLRHIPRLGNSGTQRSRHFTAFK